MNLFVRKPTLWVGFFLSTLLVSCATYQGKVEGARRALLHHDYQKALSELAPLAEKSDGDQLVYLLDYAVAQQLAGDLKGSNQTFLKAERLSEAVDYQSVSRVAGSLALNEEMVQYKGDTFEKVFINAFLAMNFLEMGDLDSALVEARKINDKYQKYRADEEKSYALNPFSKYLSAIIWESNGNYDDAYIAYNDAYKIDPSIPTIAEDLIRSAKLARRMDSYNEWKKKFPQVVENPKWYDPSKGEVILLFQQGWGPRKVTAQNQYRFPALMPVRSQTQEAQIQIGNQKAVTSSIYDVQSAAIKTLNEDQGILVAKRIAGLATKAVLADQVRQKDELLGSLMWIAMNVADRADVRQWSTLPQSIQIARLRLDPGVYQADIKGLDISGQITGEQLDQKNIPVRAGKNTFIVWRSLK